MKLRTTETFCATHHLPHQGGKCMNLHGHNYKAEITIEVPDNHVGVGGMIIDFGKVKAIVNQYDHAIIIHGGYSDSGIYNLTNSANLRGRNLDRDIESLAVSHKLKLVKLGMDTTAENLAKDLAKSIGDAVQLTAEVCKADLKVNVLLWETDKNSVEAEY